MEKIQTQLHVLHDHLFRNITSKSTYIDNKLRDNKFSVEVEHDESHKNDLPAPVIFRPQGKYDLQIFRMSSLWMENSKDRCINEIIEV